MDIGLLRTFLEVYRVRHFGRAAENLCITQSAVSARIHLLEERLGEKVFERVRHNIRLTPAGQRLLPHAETVLSAWQRAIQDVGMQDDDRSLVVIGAEPPVWSLFLGECFQQIYRDSNDIAFALQTHPAEPLHRRLIDGMVDMAFSYQPLLQEGLVVREAVETRLVMVSGSPGRDVGQALSDGYILTEWGGPFAAVHSRAFPDAPPPALRLSYLPLARSLLANPGTAAYLPGRQAEMLIERGELFRVDGAPEFKLTVYAAFRQSSEQVPLLDRILSAVSRPVQAGVNEKM